MKKLFIINDTLTNKISYYHLALFLIFLPFDRFYRELVLISLTVHTLIHVGKINFRALFHHRDPYAELSYYEDYPEKLSGFFSAT